jgi:germination protein M
VTARPRRRYAAPLVAAAAALLLTLPALSACGGHRDAGNDDSGRPADATASAAGGSPPSGETTPGPAGAAAPPAAGAAAPAAAGGEAAGAVPIAPEEETRKEVVLFFQKSDEDLLGPEKRLILPGTSVVDQGKQLVAELIAGPRAKGLLPTIPEGTTILGLYLDRKGTAFLDLSDEFVSSHPEGSSEDLATVFSIVDSLTYNLPEIKRVRFLVGGEEREALNSHLDLRRAWLKDMSIVKMDGGR